MKISIVFSLLFVGVALAQDEGTGVVVATEWPQNDDALAGAIINMVYEGLGEGSCFVRLPSAVNMFHVMNGHIVPGVEESNPSEGIYKIAAPASWEAINGTFNVLVMFERDDIFNLTDIEFRCSPDDVEDVSVYSFPQNNLAQEASSNVHYRPGFHQGDVLTITLPAPVARFNFTTMDSEYTVDYDSSMTSFTLSGFKNPPGVDEMKEVHFSIDYENESDDGANWFSAGDVTVSIENNP